MKRLGNKVFSSVIACAVAIALAACGGHGSHSTLPAVGAAGTTVPSDKLVSATFAITIPAPSTANAKGRKPQYVSAATKAIRINMTATTNTTYPSAINVLTQVTNGTGNAPGSPCTGSGPWTCTVTVKVPPGDDTFTFTTYDDTTGTGSGASHILSQQVQTLTVAAGTANAFTVTFDANTGTLNVLGSQPCQNATVIASSYGSVGTSVVTLNLQYLDLAGKTIVDPGKPVVSAFDSTTSTYTTSGRMNGTSGTFADFSINRSAQTLTLTPSSSSVTGVTVSLKAVPANTTGSSDGLPQGGATKSFTFSTGPAPPGSFLAAVQQTGTNSGEVDLYTIAVGATSGSSDMFQPYITTNSTNVLSVTGSSNEPGHFDVDNPEGLVFDSLGDLLIANGGTTTGGDDGNLACIPAGSIATGANNATTNSTDVDLGSPMNPIALLGDQSVVLANQPTNAPVQVDAFTLAGNYVQSPSRSLTAAPFGAYSVAALPSPAANSYAVALTDGTSTHFGTGHNQVTIVKGSGGSYDITDVTVDVPHSVAWDGKNSQLVIASNSTFHLDVDFYTLGISSATKVTTINTNLNNSILAVSSGTDTTNNGKIAVSGESGSGYSQIQVYDNTSSRNLLTIIPWNLVNGPTGCSGGFTYGATVVTALTWISNTKLLVALKSTTTSLRGLHIFDVSSPVTVTQHDDQTCAAEPVPSSKETGTKLFTNTPFGLAFKP